MPELSDSSPEALAYYRDVIDGIARYIRDGGLVVLNAFVSDDAINITFALPRDQATPYFSHLTPPPPDRDEPPGTG